MPLSQVIAPTAEPLSLTEAKAHLRATTTDEDTLITGWITAAREAVENHTGLRLITQTWEYALDCFPNWDFELPIGPLAALSSITYVDGSGVTQTLATTEYLVDRRSVPGRVMPAYGEVWPFTREQANAVIVKFVAGFATPVDSIDTATEIITAAGHPYANSDPISLRCSGGTLFASLTEGKTYYASTVSGNTLKLSLTAGGAAIDLTGSLAASSVTTLGIVPPTIREAMLLMLNHFDQHREAASDFPVHELPLGVDRLLFPHRILRF